MDYLMKGGTEKLLFQLQTLDSGVCTESPPAGVKLILDNTRWNSRTPNRTKKKKPSTGLSKSTGLKFVFTNKLHYRWNMQEEKEITNKANPQIK